MINISIDASRVINKRAIKDNPDYPLKGRPKGRPGQVRNKGIYHWPKEKKIIVTEYAAPGKSSIDFCFKTK